MKCLNRNFDSKKYFDKTGYIYGVMRRRNEDGTQIKCGVVMFRDYNEAQKWVHYEEKIGFDPDGYEKSLVSKSQAYGFIHFH